MGVEVPDPEPQLVEVVVPRHNTDPPPPPPPPSRVEELESLALPPLAPFPHPVPPVPPDAVVLVLSPPPSPPQPTSKFKKAGTVDGTVTVLTDTLAP